MITGLGVDIVEIDRMREAHRASPAHQGAAASLRRSALLRHARQARDPLRRCASRRRRPFSRPLGTGFSGMRFTDVEVARESERPARPQPVGPGCRDTPKNSACVEMHLSLSFTHTTAVASAVAITEESRPRKDGALPTRWPSWRRSFKEMRTMLDDPLAPQSDDEVPEQASELCDDPAEATSPPCSRAQEGESVVAEDDRPA